MPLHVVLPGPTILHCNTPLHKPCKPCKPPGQAAHTDSTIAKKRTRQLPPSTPSADRNQVIIPAILMLRGHTFHPLKWTYTSKVLRTLRTIYQSDWDTPHSVLVGSTRSVWGRGVEMHRIVNTCQPWVRACCGAMGQADAFLLSGNSLRRIKQARLVPSEHYQPKLNLAVPMLLHAKLS
ncbi:hypothetical protein J3458_022495 [Metarhizium acridum]|uniref:uncharacterized protein n=1 Tax=Metarhizium acridum TaxID=92637 RepID=UPI001C6CFEEF|nr:hypothetical protein J3458_022495 [Metarhizium acridum]